MTYTISPRATSNIATTIKDPRKEIKWNHEKYSINPKECRKTDTKMDKTKGKPIKR